MSIGPPDHTTERSPITGNHFILLLIATWLIGIGSLGYLHNRLNYVVNAYERLFTREIRQQELSRQMQVAFKKQVQEWKDILLRGHTPVDLKIYKENFEIQEKRVRSLSALLAADIDPETGVLVDRFDSLHAAIGAHYRTALRSFELSKGQAYRSVDAQVRGEDRPPTDLIDGIVEQLSTRVDKQRAVIARELWFFGVVLTVCFVFFLALSALIVRIVLEIRRASKSLLYHALHDNLTGLPNRAHFEDSIQRALAWAERTRNKTALFYIDLNRFKNVNDTCGHFVGDLLLKEVATRLRDVIGVPDVLSRVGGDEFTVIVNNAGEDNALTDFAERVTDSLAAPFFIAGKELHISASLGIACYPEDARDAGTLFINADAAMYQIKRSGESGFSLYNRQIGDLQAERKQLETDLAGVLERS